MTVCACCEEGHLLSLQGHSVFGECTVDVIRNPDVSRGDVYSCLFTLDLFNHKSQKEWNQDLEKKNAAEYAKQTPQATFESGTLRNTALRIWMENWVEDWKTFLSSIYLICYWSVSLKPQDIAHLRTSILRLLVSLACKWPHLLGFQQLWPLFHTFIINNFKLLFLIYNLMDLTNLELCVLFKTVLTSANKKVLEPTLYLLHIIVLRRHCLPVRHWSKSIFLLKQGPVFTDAC